MTLTQFDPVKTLEIPRSRGKQFLLGVFLTAFAAAASWIVLNPGERLSTGSFKYAVICLGAALSGLFAVRAFWQMFTTSGPALVLSPEGIFDPSIAADVIPWTGIRRIAPWTYRGQTTIILDLDPALEEKLKLTRMARLSRAPNRALGADGFNVGSASAAIKTQDLLKACIAYWQAAALRGA